MSENNKTQVIKESINTYIDKLCLALKEGHTDFFKQYLKVISKFHSYSFGNQVLIASQNPNATRVAGFKTWQNLNRTVKKGEKAIYILAPIKGKKIVEKDGKEEEKNCLWFRAVPVFDIAQTEGEELPTWTHSLGEDNLNIYNRLKSVMVRNGISVEEKSIAGGALGISYGGRVEIEQGLDPLNKALTLIHEYAHELLHKGGENKSLSRGFKECQAEATCWVVAQHFGLDSPMSKDYLLNWGNNEEEVRKNLAQIIEASSFIIDILEQEVVGSITVSVENELIAA